MQAAWRAAQYGYKRALTFEDFQLAYEQGGAGHGAAHCLLDGNWQKLPHMQPFHTRIGMHTGVVIAGVLGSSDRLSYTALGDVINAASRIEGSNKELGTRTLMSEATHAGLNGRLPTRRIEEQVALRGRQTRMVLYELLEEKEAPSRLLNFSVSN